MTYKKLLIAGLLSGIFAFFLGFLLWGVLLMGFSEAHTTEYPGLEKEKMSMLLILLSCIVWGFFISWVYLNFPGRKSSTGGALTGLITGMLVASSMNLSMLSMWNLFTPLYLLVDVLVNGIYSAAIGAVAGYILRTRK